MRRRITLCTEISPWNWTASGGRKRPHLGFTSVGPIWNEC